MNIKLKKLKLINFKGAKNLEVDFDDQTDIMGRNASGKSTVFDSFTWLLFGKNSQDKKDFEIKTLDKHNMPISKIDHEVEGILLVDGIEITLKRCYREIWRKPKGQPEAIFSGHETLYWWNEVPLNQKDYQEKVAGICEESLFKLITNPSAFNDLNWTKQREILFDIAGEVTNQEVIVSMVDSPDNPETDHLIEVLDSGKRLDEYKKEIASKKKKLSDELKEIPTRIDEIYRNLPDPVDTQAINKIINDCNVHIDELEKEISDRSAANESQLKYREEKQSEIYALRNKIQELQFADRQANQKKEQESQGVCDLIKADRVKEESRLEEIKNTITHNSNRIVELVADIDRIRKEWHEVNEHELKFDENEFHCPACKREFEAEDVESKKQELTTNFNTDKQRRLSSISDRGKKAKQEKDSLITQNESLESQAANLKSNIDHLLEKEKKAIETAGDFKIQVNPQIKELEEKVIKINDELQSEEVPNSNDLISKKREVQDRITSLKQELSVNEQIDKSNARISELEAQAKKLGQEVADLEKVEYTIASFTKKKIEMVEGKINAKFKMVSFKMYKELINGGEEETCIALVDGVPYSDANNASRINAGLDIINALSEHYEVTAPIFIDNAESVNKLLPTESQVVRLIVTEDEKLKVSAVSKVEFETV